MPNVTSNPAADLLGPISRCEAGWGKLDCPNEVAYVIVNTKAPGFCPVCKVHTEIWPKSNVERGYSIVITLAEFESLRRRGLYTQYMVPGNVPRNP